jgi:hypothetical protein
MIGWYVHHVGLGHSTRAVAIVEHLQGRVTGFGSRPRPVGWTQPWVALDRDDTDPAPDDGADVTAHGTLHWVPRHHRGLITRQARLVEWLHAERPDLVVVDVSVEVAALTRLCGVPVVVVGGPGDRGDRAHTLAYDLADALLAPWPAGTLEAAWPQRWREKTCCVGALSRFDDAEPSPTRPGSRTGRRVLVLWGGGGRSTTAEQVVAARVATPGWEWSERRPGSPGDLWSDLLAADVVVTHAGQNAVAEVAAARRPAVVVAQQRPHAEQEATAGAVASVGAAAGLPRWPAVTEWPRLLDEALERGGEGWAAWNPRDGAARAAAHVDDLAHRLSSSGGAA